MTEPNEKYSPPPIRVLVVDDSATNLDIMEALLVKLGCDVRCAASGQEALDLFSQSPGDLVFMDFHMPQMDGLEVTREMRRREGSERHTPIIGLTAGDTHLSNSQCLEAGMDDILIKPVLGAQLKTILVQWVTHVDKRQLADLREELGGRSSTLYQQAVTSFLKEAELHLSVLAQAVSKGQAEAIQHEVHLLKGASGYFGALTLQKLCHRIESFACAEDIAAIDPYVQSLIVEFGRVRIVLNEELIHGSA
jgi:CheY-like chemotaxis protein